MCIELLLRYLISLAMKNKSTYEKGDYFNSFLKLTVIHLWWVTFCTKTIIPLSGLFEIIQVECYLTSFHNFFISK